MNWKSGKLLCKFDLQIGYGIGKVSYLSSLNRAVVVGNNNPNASVFSTIDASKLFDLEGFSEGISSLASNDSKAMVCLGGTIGRILVYQPWKTFVGSFFERPKKQAAQSHDGLRVYYQCSTWAWLYTNSVCTTNYDFVLYHRATSKLGRH